MNALRGQFARVPEKEPTPKSKRKKVLCVERLEARAMLSAISISDSSTLEGNSYHHAVFFQVSLDQASTNIVTAAVRTFDGSAVAGSDYVSRNTQITFAPGETLKRVAVLVDGDTIVEPDETFYVSLSSVQNATLERATAIGTILNDDTAPVTPPPSPPITYGTTSPVGPLSGVVAPAGAIILSASSGTAANQQAIDNAPDGATIFFQAGTYRDLQIVPTTNEKLIGQYGAILTSTTKNFAIWSLSQGIEVRNLVIDGYVPELQQCSLGAGDGWKVMNCEVRNSGMGGIGGGSNTLIESNYVHDNQQIGLHVEGNNTIVRNNEVAFNNAQFAFDMYWEAGGSKFWNCQNLLVEHNNFHDNGGEGIWCDFTNLNVTIQYNWSHHNALSGIFYEISGAADIANNLLAANGWGYVGQDWIEGAGIIIKTSHDVIVENNIVLDNLNGIDLESLDEGFRPDGQTRYTFGNNTVRNNVIAMNGGITGVWWDGAAISNPFNGGSVWTGNGYTLSGGASFAWQQGQNLTLSQWQAIGPGWG